jgi:uncharacterized protein
MIRPLMPKATAVWLVDNTSLTFDQIAEFCGLHVLEVRGIADGEVMRGILGVNPIHTGQLTRAEITRCEQDPKAKLALTPEMEKTIKEEQKKKTGSYTPIVRRQDKPDAILWMLKNCPQMTNTQISKLLGTTKNTINAIKDKTHWNYHNLRPKDPVLLGLCTQTELNIMYEKANQKKLQEDSELQSAKKLASKKEKKPNKKK